MHPLTKITNKHLLPVYNKPMIFYPIQTLVDAGVRVKEIPIELPIRTHGQSKMRMTDVIASLQRLVQLYGRSFQIKRELRKLNPPEAIRA